MAKVTDFDSLHAGSVVVLDTNVLLLDPSIIFSFGEAEVVIPETVLSEVDKLKTARVDNDLKFKGREVTRLLFEIGNGENLVEGVELESGGRLRVMPYEHNPRLLPDGFGTRTSDEKILASTYVLYQDLGPKCSDLRLITNDLNMLLKAQTLGICVMRCGRGDDVGFMKKYIVRPFNRYRVPVIILIIATAIFAASSVMLYTYGSRTSRTNALPSEFREVLTQGQRNAYDALLSLQSNPADSGALLTLGNFYSARSTEAQLSGNNAQMISDAKIATRYYEKYLSYVPGDVDARTDLAIQFFNTGNTDRAIQEVARALESNVNHVKANYNLGVFYYFGRNDLKSASSQMQKVIELTKDGSLDSEEVHILYEQARRLKEQIDSEATETNTTKSTELGSSNTNGN